MLTESEINRLHQATLTVLEECGVTFHYCPEARVILESAGCRIDQEKVYFQPNLVDECLTKVPDRDSFAFYSPDESSKLTLSKGATYFATMGNPFYLHEYKNDTVRDANYADRDGFVYLFGQLKNFDIYFGRYITQEERKGGEPTYLECATPEETIAFIHHRFYRQRVMHKVSLPSLGRNQNNIRAGILRNLVFRNNMTNLVEKPLDVVWVNSISPLQHDDQMYGMIEAARLDQPIMVSPDVLLGGTGPITMAGALVQQNAEVLSALVLAQLVKPGTKFIYGSVSNPMDLRVAELSMGNIEQAMLTAASVQLADHYGLPSRVSCGNTGAKTPGVRAAVEASMGNLIGAMAGGNIITTGNLDCTSMMSYEHLVMLNEVFHHIRRYMKGISLDGTNMALDLIREQGHPGSNFIGHKHTFENMKKEIYLSDFIGRIPAASEDWYAKAHSKVKTIMTKENLEAFKWDKSIQEKIETLEQRIREDNETWKSDRPDWWEKYVKDFA
jgi:trimethylamine--corrinoid protein Co-methyltransferase